MSLHHHIQLMAQYNERLNRQFYAAAAAVSTDELAQDRGAFFGSILGTLNHLVVADIVWLKRFTVHSSHYRSLRTLEDFPEPQSLDHVLYPKIADLDAARIQLDQMILHWAAQEITAEDLERDLTYANRKGEVSSRNFAELVLHMFNHQTHHRGQASTLLSQLGVDVGVTDFLVDIPTK